MIASARDLALARLPRLKPEYGSGNSETIMIRNLIPGCGVFILIFALLAGCMSALYPTGNSPGYTSLRFKPGSEPTGFRGIKWGTPISELPGMKHVSTDEDRVETYFKEGDELRIGRAKVEKIGYQFWKGRFLGVEISAKESKNCGALREAVFETFGSGLKALRTNKNDFGEKYIYQGNMAVVFLSIEEKLEDFGMLILLNKKMKEELKAERKERTRKSF